MTASGLFAQNGGLAIRTQQGAVLLWDANILGESKPVAGWVGYHVYRSAAQQAATRLTTRPLGVPRNAEALQTAAGSRLTRWMKAAQAETPAALLEKMLAEHPRLRPLFLYDPFFAEVAGTRFSDRTARPDVAYEYRIVQVRDDGSESAPVATLMLPAGTPVFPEPPATLKATFQGTDTVLQWPPSRSPQAHTYRIYRSAALHRGTVRLSANPIIMLAQDDTPPEGIFADSTLQVGETAYYAVSAVDVAGNEGELRWSDAITRKATPSITAPSGITATSTEGGVQLNWKPAQATGYGILRANVAQPNAYRLLTQTILPPETTSFTDAEANTGGAGLLYRIVAYREDGSIADSSAQIAAVYEDEQILPPPEKLQAQWTPDGLRLTWKPLPNVLGYEVFQLAAPNADPVQRTNRIPAQDSVWVLLADFVQEGATAGFSIMGINQSGHEGQISTPVWTQRAITPDPPRAFQVTPTPEGLVLMWEAPQNVKPAMYQIFREQEGVAPILLKHVPVDSTLIWVDAQPIQQTIRYRIQAVMPDGTASFPAEAVFNQIAQNTIRLRATQTDQGVVLQWNDATQPYQVLRRINGGDWQTLANDAREGIWLDPSPPQNSYGTYTIAPANDLARRAPEVFVYVR